MCPDYEGEEKSSLVVQEIATNRICPVCHTAYDPSFNGLCKCGKFQHMFCSELEPSTEKGNQLTDEEIKRWENKQHRRDRFAFQNKQLLKLKLKR